MSFDLISDLHKDARGFRPSGDWMEMFNGSDEQVQEEIWNNLCKELEENEALQKEVEEDALYSFRAAVRLTMDMVNCKWNDAVRHLCIAEGEDPDCDQGFDHFLWKNDLGYSDRLNIRKLYKEAV